MIDSRSNGKRYAVFFGKTTGDVKEVELKPHWPKESCTCQNGWLNSFKFLDGDKEMYNINDCKEIY